MAKYENNLEAVEKESNHSKSFLLGALVGGLVGAATALFFAPKTGKDFRITMNEQASYWKDKGEQLRNVAMNKGSEWVAVAKDKSMNLSNNRIKTNGNLNLEADFRKEEKNIEDIDYIQLVPSNPSHDELQKKLQETQRAFEEEEHKIR